MRKPLLVIVLALLVGVVLPVLAQDTNTNVNVNANANVNVNTNVNMPPAAKPWRARPIFLAHAEIKAINGQTLTVATKDNKTYTVNVADKTKLLRKYGAKSNLGEFAVGNVLQVYGKRTAETVIDATLIRNSSIQKKNATFLGTIQSLDTTAQKFVLKPVSRKTITVSVAPETKILEKSKTKTFADLVVGAKVTASGVWDMSNDTLTEVKKVVIVSIPKTAVKPAPNTSGSQPQSGTVTVNMTATGFSPNAITVVKGTTVNFVNQDTNPHWPASAPHPTHTIYPQFDPKKNINAGETWSFTFDRLGTWRYHDHLNPGLYGTVTVTEQATTGGNEPG